MAIQLGSAYGKVSLDSSGITKGVNQGIQSIAKLTAAGTNLGNSMKTIGSSMASFGQQMTVMFTLPIAALGAKSFQVMKDFDGSLNVLKAVANSTNAEMEEMTKLAKQLGADLTLPGTSAADAAAAMAEMAKAGLKVNDIMASAKGVLQLSAAGQIDNARAAEITANALNAFKLKGEDAVMIADLLAASANASSAEVKEMADSLQMSAAVMSMSGISIQETVTALGLLANAGIQGSDAGTSLKQMFLALQAPSGNQMKVMKKYGLEIYNAAGEMKSMREMIVEFSSKLGGLTEKQRNFALGTLFGSDAVRAANIVLMQGTEQYDKMSVAINKTGAAADLATALMEGLPGVVENIKSSFETAAIAAIEPFKEDIIAVGEGIAKLMNFFSNLPAPIRKAIVVWLAMLALVGPMLVFIGTILTMAGTVVNAIGVLSTMGVSFAGITTAIGAVGTAITGTLIPALAALLAPLLPVIGTVLLVVAVVGLLYYAWKKNLFGIQDLVAKSAAGYRQAWERFTTWWKENTATAGEEVQATFAGMPTSIQASFRNLGTSISGAWQNFMSWLRNALSQARNYIANAFSNVNWGTVGKNILMGLANGMLLGLPNLLLIAKKIADGLLKQIKSALGIKSPSAEAMKLGKYTAQGFQLGLQSISPDALSRSLTKPITNSTANQQNLSINLSSGLTMRQAQSMIAENNEQLMNTMINALGGA